jgi:hypothetical protein
VEKSGVQSKGGSGDCFLLTQKTHQKIYSEHYLGLRNCENVFYPADFPAGHCSISTQWQVETTAATGRPGLRQGATRKSFDPVAELADLG